MWYIARVASFIFILWLGSNLSEEHLTAHDAFLMGAVITCVYVFLAIWERENRWG